MKTLKEKMLTPMILLVVLVPMATLLFFNVAVHIYIQKEARNDLKAAMTAVEMLAQQELGRNDESLSEARLESIADKFADAIQNSKPTDAKLLIYNGELGLVYPQSLPEGFVTANLAEKAVARLETSGFPQKVERIRFGKSNFLVFGCSVDGSQDSHVFLVLVSLLDTSVPLIKIVNLILIVIMLIGIGLGVFTVSGITKRVSNQVKQINKVTERIGQGDFTHTILGDTDIAEFNELCQSIVHMSNRLESSERSQRDFLQNASHELRTPLMSIQGYAEGISSGIVPDVKVAADIINSESLRINTLVEELLTLSRIESGTLNRELVRLDLCELLNEYTMRLGGIAVKQQKKIILFLPSEPVFVKGDDELLGRAVANIVSNCLRYARNTVAISLVYSEGSVVIRISDDGPGISRDELPHIFERFYKGKDGNFGLGLAIAKSAVQYIGGNIKAYSEETGAEFDILFAPADN